MPKYIGYHEKKDIPFKAGQEVVIPRGVVVKSMNPSKNEFITSRIRKIVIDHVLTGCDDGFTAASNPSVRWAGTGGYWNEVDINDILDANGIGE
jgi:hypothetical protein